MRTILRKAVRDESGKILILVLVLLVVGGLLLGPLLGLMSTGLMAGQVYERKTAQLYAADAGIEDGIWKIQNADIAGLPGSPCGDKPWDYAYDIPEAINRNHVRVSIVYLGEGMNWISSTAADDDGQTTVESYVKATLKPTDEWEWDVVVPGGTAYEGGNIEDGQTVYVDGDLTMADNIENPGTFLYVKGDLTMTGTDRNNIEDGAIVYVEGNLSLAYGIGETGTIVCVGGNVTIPKVETGAQLRVEGDLTVSGKIENDETTICVGGEFQYGTREDDPTIHAEGFEPFADCPICCWGCLQVEYELVLEVSSYQIGSSA